MNRRILTYALLAVAVAGAGAQVLSPRTSARLDAMQRQGTKIAASDKTVSLFIRVDEDFDLALLEKEGVSINSVSGNTLTARAPMNMLESIAKIPGVNFIKMSDEVKLLLDKARKASGVADLHAEMNDDGVPYKGKGVVIGVVDTGLEYKHPAFRDEEGNLRLKRVWDQNRTGETPEGFDYGKEIYTEEALLAQKYDTGAEYHATHVTNIAAGANTGSLYYGVAPDSEIVFVSFEQTDVSIVDGVKYIFDYAESVGKPCVVNLSLGQHYGPHDGTSIIDEMLDALTGPGRIIVGACGNEAGSNMHASKKFTSDDNILKTMLGYPTSSTASKETHIDIWANDGADIKVRFAVVDPLKGKILYETASCTPSDEDDLFYFTSETGASCVFYTYPMLNSENGRPEIYVVSQVDMLSDARRLAVIVEGKEGDEVHMWNVGGYDFVAGNGAGWTPGDNACTAGEIGGTGKNVISVGSYNTRYMTPIWWGGPGTVLDFSQQLDLEIGKISSFSSRGPTADGRLKPEVVAPGALIVSAVNQHCYLVNLEQTVDRIWDETTSSYYHYDLDLGTSMAAPFVAGTVATWLQADPTLTPEQVREVLKRTSLRDSYTGEEENNTYGYGKIQSYQGLLDVLGKIDYSSVEQISNSTVYAWAERGNGVIRVSSPEPSTVEVFTIGGVKVLSATLEAGLNSVDASSLPGGVYIVRVAGRTETKTLRTVI